MGKGQASQPFTKSLNKDEQEVVSGKQNVKAACPKEYKLFSSPWGRGEKGGGLGRSPSSFCSLMFSGRAKYTYIHHSLVHGFNRYNVI